MDFTKVKVSPNIKDETDPKRRLVGELLAPYEPWGDGSYDWNTTELKRLQGGEDVHNLLRDRMRNMFLMNWFLGNVPPENFDPHREIFPAHSNLRKRSQGAAYDNN